ncbi:MAG: DNA translocase FtsK 4TM domain-containing protein, partial [Paludibacteraceae bacterium]|nr:DNA translocase FtsK 4TM domain-containing protein [Paludibacteraceae bacterium]
MARRTSQPAGERYNDAQIKVVSEHTAWGDFMAFIKSDKFRFIVGLLLAFITVYLFIAYISFFSTGADDFSILERSSSERKILRENIDNITGLPGAIATYLLVNKFCGLPVLFLYILSFIFSLRWMGIIRIHKWRVLFTYLFILLWGSLALAFVQNVFNLSLFFRLGGNLGDMVIQYAISYIHVIGTVFVLFATLFVFLICIDERTIVFFYRAGLWLKKCIQRGFVALKEKRMQRQQEQEKEKETKETAPVEPENEMEEQTQPTENTETDIINSIDLEIQGSTEPETPVQPNDTPTPTLESVSSAQEEVENEVIETESVIEKEENITSTDENPPLDEETEEQKLT